MGCGKGFGTTSVNSEPRQRATQGWSKEEWACTVRGSGAAEYAGRAWPQARSDRAGEYKFVGATECHCCGAAVP